MNPNSMVWLIYRALKVNPVKPYRFRKDMDVWARITAKNVHRFLTENNVVMTQGEPLEGHGRHLGAAQSAESDTGHIAPTQPDKDKD